MNTQSTIVTQSGRTRTLPVGLEPERVAGLDQAGRIVVDDFNARAEKPGSSFMFGLTLCCNAYDKGAGDAVVCRGCYSEGEVGSYLYRSSDGTFPGLDPVKELRS